MSLIGEIFSRKKPLICYFMAGYPSLEKSYETAKALIQSGADILEVGVPFSDPVADGPTIQVAHEKAVKDGITPVNVFQLTEKLKKEFPDIPLILMTYYNPIYVMGEQDFCKLAKEKGADGFIVPDLPPEEAENFKRIANSSGLETIFLLAPTSHERRIKLIGEMSDSFIYYVSLTGITGERDTLPWEELENKVRQIKKITGKKVAVGFGVSKKEHTQKLSQISDGVIVGSAVVKLQGKADIEGIKSLVKQLKEGME
ncbi:MULTISPECIES: tryptophan synthase subunit alpha [Persephonella]|uniref:Tryptophan synthase alpha chain n=1 Tax=Persephonella marina (strain DSM 14350 / EX-H1) TaxID=123214 RepID=C0QR00_PERMH|nr:MULTISPECIES: tryptophan synthase subunit alpha [Persephonella]ACO03694.1 tryptophan synthase, alpha subunit [Persephonella marina EX-H1]